VAAAGRSEMELPAPEGKLTVNGADIWCAVHAPADSQQCQLSPSNPEKHWVLSAVGAGKTIPCAPACGTGCLQSGMFRLDGRIWSVLADQDRLQYIGYLPQDVELLGGTVKEE